MGEKPEIQTVVLSPTRTATLGDKFDGIGGHFTLAYTDMYGQTWTTRPIRVKTKVSTAGTVVNPTTNDYSTIVGDYADFGLFQDHDNILVKVGTGNSVVVKVKEHGAGMQALVVEPQLTAVGTSTTITLTLVNQDAGEIGVTRALTELPNQVIPSITVDETITTRVNVFRITFSDIANAGDQASLSCRVDACDTDGCQPRKGAMVAQQSSTTGNDVSGVKYVADNFKIELNPTAGLEVGDQIAIDLASPPTSPPAPPATVESVTANTHVIIKERNYGSTNNQPAGNANVKFLNNLNDRDKQEALKKTFTCADSGSCVVDNVANDAGDFACTGGGNGCGFSLNDIVLLTSQPGLGQSESPNDGLHRVKATSSDKVTLEGLAKAVSAVSSGDDSGNIVLTRVNTFPCAVLETRKGTSESLECSGRGTCDGSSGQCECFEGYTSD